MPAVTVLADHVDERSEAYQANRAHLLELLAEHDRQLALVNGGGGDKYVARHRQRGKLLARERIELLVDPDSPLLELSPLAAWGTDFPVGAGVVTGIGVVEGVECVIIANDPTVRGGTSTTCHRAKTLRAMEIARGEPPAAADPPRRVGRRRPAHQSRDLRPRRARRSATSPSLSAAGIPTIALVFGNSTAGGAYVPGMCDYVVMIDQRSKVFLGGPPLVKMATGEESDDESLGGAEMHAAGQRPRRLLRRRRARRPPHRPRDRAPPQPAQARPGPRGAGRPPRYDPEELLGIASADLRCRSTRATCSPASSTAATSTSSSRATAPLVTGWAELHGYPDRRPRQPPRRAVQRGVAEGDAVHPARQPDRHAAAVPAEHHRLHGRQGVRAAAASSRTARR